CWRLGHLGQRPAPAFVAAGDRLLQARHGVWARGDARLLGDGRPTLVVDLPPGLHQRPARASQYLGQRAGVVNVARGPVALVDQFGDQLARRGAVTHELVDEGAAVAAAVDVDVGQLGIDP